MQTTGLFSSSSPQQANVGGGSSLIGTLGAALVLVFGVVLLTGLSLDRTQTAMVRFLAEKGVALVTALESGVRSGTRSRTGIRLQYLVEELADRPDVRFIAVTMPDGTILAHSTLRHMHMHMRIIEKLGLKANLTGMFANIRHCNFG